MSLNYDECLNQNPFFKAVQENHSDIIKKATEEDWIICVPRIGTIEPTTISTEDILEHILVPNLDLPHTHFCTLTKREVVIQDKVIVIKRDKTIRILFDETFYIDKSQKYKLWCIERPLHQCSPNHEAYISIRNVQDCIKLLWRRSNCILDDINKVIQTFLREECEFDELDVLQEKVSVLYANCIEVTSNSKLIQDDNVNLAVETYMQHCIHRQLFRAVCNCTWQVDASFNKTHQSFSDIQLKDLEIGHEFFESVSRAKRELSSINKFSTALGKVECLRRAVNTLSHKIKKQALYAPITTDDLLKIFVFLVAKSSLSNWIGNLMYVTHFRFSSINLSDENSFLITTLEAAIEYIKSGMLCPKIDLSKSSMVINTLNSYFMCVKDGNLEAIQNVFDDKTKNFLIIDKTLRCHPLCSCDKCGSVAPFSINSHDDKGCTALHVACLYGQPHVVEYLIGKGVEVDVLDYSESMPLHYAALKGNQNALLLLLHSNAQIDPKDCEGNTPLQLAANNGHESCVKALLYFAEQKGFFFDVNSGNNMGDTALHFAVKWGYASIAHILLQYGANLDLVNKRNQKACDIVHNDYLKKLLTASGDAQNRNQQDISSNQQQKNAEELSVRPKNFHEIKKVDLALKSIENNDLPLTCYYLGIPTPPSASNSNAKSTCHPLCTCKNCLKQFENATIPSAKYGESLNINTCNAEGVSPLHVAAKCGRTEIFRLLLDSGALVNVKTYKHQQTPLHLACKTQRIQIVRELLQCGGCDLEVQDAKGNLPLHYACLSNNSRIVELLLSHGSDCNIKNCEGKTPLQESKGRMLYNIVSLLKGKGENSDSSETGSDFFSF